MATAKKVVKKKKPSIKKTNEMKSFKLCKDTKPFMSFRITKQTLYWLILLTLIVMLALWVLNIQISTTDILNSI